MRRNDANFKRCICSACSSSKTLTCISISMVFACDDVNFVKSTSCSCSNDWLQSLTVATTCPVACDTSREAFVKSPSFWLSLGAFTLLAMTNWAVQAAISCAATINSKFCVDSDTMALLAASTSRLAPLATLFEADIRPSVHWLLRL